VAARAAAAREEEGMETSRPEEAPVGQAQLETERVREVEEAGVALREPVREKERAGEFHFGWVSGAGRRESGPEVLGEEVPGEVRERAREVLAVPGREAHPDLKALARGRETGQAGVEGPDLKAP
jgi:hypothetical protein